MLFVVSLSAGSGPAPITIASWNVHMGLHNDGGRNDVVAECVALDADVVVLQEAWWYGERDSDLTEQVAEALGAMCHSFSTPVGMYRYLAQWTVAIFTKIPATRLPDVDMRGLKQAPRPILRVRLDESDLTVAGAHLEGVHALKRSPLHWQRQRKVFGDACATTDVFCGDLNMWGPVVERDAAPLRRAFKGRTWPAWRPHSQIDHILVSDRVEVLDGDVIANRGSDHRAVRATLRPTGNASLRSDAGAPPTA